MMSIGTLKSHQCLVATLLGEGQSKIKPRADDALEAVAKASRIRE